MVTELGHFAAILALLVAIGQSTLPMIGASRGHRGLMSLGDTAAFVQFALLALAFAALTRAFVLSDFSVQLVLLNSHSAKPMLYKITGTWGNHEGSMLLWSLILALFGAAVALFGGGLPQALRARVLAVQGAIGVAFLAFVLFTSNPFLRVPVPPFDGKGLNPLLQDPGLAFHPPFLYLGYVGLSVTFAFAVAALIEGRVDAAWGRWVRPWTLAAWTFLTIGIALGSWWAYYELGWGGFWFWDPVENASFMPWLLSVALLHSSIVVEKRESLRSWTVLLAILAFGFSLVGTFIVRSGLLTSVHAFASDPERGVFILLILVAFVGGALTLLSLRSGTLDSRGAFGLASRESALVLNNVLLGVGCLVVFVGTIWPLVAEIAFDRKLSVGPPFFNAAFTPFMLALGLLLPVGSMLAWKRGRIGRTLRQLRAPALLAVALAGLAWSLQGGRSLAGPLCVLVGAWIASGALTDLWLRASGSGPVRIRRIRRADLAKAVAHAGFGVTIFAIGGLVAWDIEDIRVATVDEPFEVGGYELVLKNVERLEGPNYFSTTATVEARRGGGGVEILRPERRDYPVAGTPTTEAAIDYRLTHDLYVVLGDAKGEYRWVLRTYVKPWANWIWAGAALMALGGALSLADRRHRVAAGERRRDGPGPAASGLAAG